MFGYIEKDVHVRRPFANGVVWLTSLWEKISHGPQLEYATTCEIVFYEFIMDYN